ncbi:MAG: hypothetical protein JRJ19_16840 [Deltaproteobacteria bacterium]|nr:hypothetical protein [Deltaproteobacteria bacterium]
MNQKENEVVDFRNTLTKTPRKLDEPVFDVHRYDITKVTRTAQVTVRITVRDEGGVKLVEEEASGSASTSDSSNPAIRKYGVKANPLKFPKTNDELTEAALEKAAAKSGKHFGGLCARWHKEILSRARQASNAAIIEATEDYVLYLFVTPGEPPAEVVQFLKQQFEFSDIKALRGNLKD